MTHIISDVFNLLDAESYKAGEISPEGTDLSTKTLIFYREIGDRMLQKKHRLTRGGFTLVELAVVMAIIVILASLIFPAIQVMRETARTTECTSNLRQVTLAWISYQDNNKGSMMPVTTWKDDPTITTNNPKTYWFGTIMPAGSYTDPETNAASTTDKLDFDSGFLMPYLESSEDIFKCPAFDARSLGQLRYGKMMTGFAYNASNLGPGPKINYTPPSWTGVYDPNQPISYKYSSVKQTSRTVVFADSVQVFDNYGAMTDPVLRENWYLDAPSTGNPTVHFRHRGDAANVAFADGHVETLKYVKPLATNYPSYFNAKQIAFAEKHKVGFVGIRGDADDRNKNNKVDDLEDILYNRDAEPIDLVPSP
jgi:prepilin-type N-terminal cleavage/methylation domain-containing protein/prepilin-type processing-associated H-X9-DG protein